MTDAIEAYREKVGEFEKARREVEKARKDAIDELLKQRRAITAQLRQLGYEGDQPEETARRKGRPVADEPPPQIALVDPLASEFTPAEKILENGHRRRRLTGAKTFEQAYCSICELNGHDLRAHRGQKHKRAFSAAELRQKGLPAK
jgi:hypothetical protein